MTLFTADWVASCDSLQHIANIALMEHKLPREDSSTLWENDDLTVRYMLEEGKLNLCLRQLKVFCETMAQIDDNGGRDPWVRETTSRLGLDSEGQLRELLRKFERDMGVLLRCALEHVEAVQTTDLPELFEHASEVLAACAQQGGRAAEINFERTQASMVLRYLRSVMLRVEELGEGRLMPHVQQLGLVPLVIGHMHAHGADKLKAEDALAGATFLAQSFDTEAFEDQPSAFLDAREKELLRDFRGLFLGAMTQEPEQRKLLRPLLDQVTRAGG